MDPSPEQCAAELLEIVPLLMRVIRSNVRSQRGPEMSVPQFRTLAFIGRNEGATLSDVAAHLGLTLSAASKLMEVLVSSKLATRDIAVADRRRRALALTAAGQRRFESARSFARDFLAQKLAGLDARERQEVHDVARLLKSHFGGEEVNANAIRKAPAKSPRKPRASRSTKQKHG